MNMNDLNESAIEQLASRGWQCAFARALELPHDVRERYPWLPAEVIEMTAELEKVVHPDTTLWLLTAADYRGESESQFAWNEWEAIEIEAAGSDAGWIMEIKAFWDNHFPVALSVGNGYGYYAITPEGSVVAGEAPDFHATTPFGGNFLDFLHKLADI